MSARIPEKRNGGIVRGNGQTLSPLKISVAIKNKDTNKWETPDLNEGESLALERAISSIRKAGEDAGLGIWNAFKEEGAILELSGEGVFVKKGQVWTDLLDDPTVGGAGTLRTNVRKTLRAVTGVLEKNENRKQASDEVAVNAESLHQEEVVIQVRVLPQPSPLLGQVTEVIRASLGKEHAFNQKVAEALIAFDNPVFSEDLTARGWTEKEIQEHKGALEALKAQSDRAVNILENTLLKLDDGNMKEAISYFCAHMQEHYPAYIRACSALVIPQKVAKGRSLTEPRLPFMLDLEHALSHAANLDTLLLGIQEGSDPKLKKIANEGIWQEALNGMQAETKKLRKELAFTPMVASLNYNLQLNQEFAKRISSFVETYEENAEQFDKVMGEYGISALDSAFIFNHYVSFCDVLKLWNGRMQKVVDLANAKEYQAALEEYTTVMEDLHAALTACVRNVYFTLKLLKDAGVQAAVKAFAAQVGLLNPNQVLADLETERAAIKQQLMYTEAIEKAQKAHIPVSARSKHALLEIESRIKAEEMALPQFTRLFDTDEKFVYMFNFGGLMHPAHPLNKVWRGILQKYNWPFNNIAQFADLMNDYAAFIRPFSQAEQGIATETNPNRKATLQKQFQELAKTRLPELRTLQKELKRLGGMDQMRTVLDATKEFGAAPELKSSKRQAASQKLQAEAQSQVQLMEDRLAYISKIYKDLPQK